MRTELASGAWIEHLPVQDLKARHIDIMSLVVQMTAPVTPDGKVDLGGGEPLRQRARAEQALRDARWAILITAWSFSLPVPSWDAEALEVRDGESIGELDADDYNDIHAILAPHTLKLFRRPDPKGPPTATTSSSNGSSRARAAGSRKA